MGKWIMVVLLYIAALNPAAAKTLTYVDLVHRITSLEDLAVLPLPGESCAQFSSYDRASRYDAATGKYVNWDANGDGSGIIRHEGDSDVLAEMTGPGCIWRTWSATPGDGHVRIYLDGAADPAVDLPFKGYFDHANAPFGYPALVHTTPANGWNNYVPIPYQKSCKIVADRGWGNYYHFTYGTFPAGTTVPTFSRDLGEPEKAALAVADRALSDGLGRDPGETSGARPGERTLSVKITAATGATSTVADIAGARAITSLHVQIDPAALAEDPDLLREVVLSIHWDDEKNPSVWTPLGDFFGTAPGVNLYKSLPVGMTEDGFYAYWYMPFAKHAHVELLNESKHPVSLQASLSHAPLTRPASELGRFHVKWHRDAFLPDPSTGRGIDWTLLQTQGTGRFCGVMLHVWNPKGGWWGEGDEKWFVDGEKFPSTFGTGSEDYFGYAWSSGTLFHHALHNQTLVDRHSGNISDNRWQITDNIPFQKSFEGSIEKYFPNKRPTLYTSTVYWYLAPGGTDPYGAVPVAERIGYDAPLVRPHPAGVIEGEDMKVLDKTGGSADNQDMGGFNGDWSGGSQLWWTGVKAGDRLTLALPVAAAGKYDVRVQVTKAVDYGMVQFSLDGQKIGDVLDLYHDGVIPSGEISLGTLELTAGEHRLGVEITGANPKAVPSHLFGLDYVRLVKE